MDVITTGFALSLQNIRKNKNLTQEQLSEDFGINIRQLARIEAGKSFVTSDTLYKICTVLNVMPAVLFNFNISNCPKINTKRIVHFHVTHNKKFNINEENIL